MKISITQMYQVFVFTIGTLLGIPLAIFLSNLMSEDITILPNPHIHPVTDKLCYNNWLSKHGVQKVLRDTSDCSNPTYHLESEYLSKHVKLTCVIYVTSLHLAYKVYNSWINKCNSFYFFGPNKNYYIPIINQGYSKFPWQRMCKSLEFLILTERSHIEWIILIGDNSFVIPENLRYSLVLLNSTKPFYGGHIKSHRHFLYASLDSGIILNVATLEILIEMGSLPCHIQNHVPPDIYLGKLLHSLNIYPKSLLDEYMCNRFHDSSLEDIFSNHLKNDQVISQDIGQVLLKDKDGICISNTSVSFKMPLEDSKYHQDGYSLYKPRENVYQYLLYQFTTSHRCQRPFVPPSFEPQEWAESVGLYFSNVTAGEILNMSSQQYYELWQKKLPKPW